MVEDPIENNKCIICGKETNRTYAMVPLQGILDIPMCGECEATTPFSKIMNAVMTYKNKRNGDDISRTLALEMKEKGYEHYLGHTYQGEEVRHFIKNGRLVTIIVNHYPDEEDIDAVIGGK